MQTIQSDEGPIDVHCEGELVGVDDINPHPRNRNNHPQEQLDRIGFNLLTLGFRSAIVVSQETGFIVCGNGTYSAAQQLGCHQVPVSRQAFSPEDEIAFLLADNNSSSLSETNGEKLLSIHQTLQDADFDSALLGLSAKDIEQLEKQFAEEDQEEERGGDGEGGGAGKDEEGDDDANATYQVTVCVSQDDEPALLEILRNAGHEFKISR